MKMNHFFNLTTEFHGGRRGICELSPKLRVSLWLIILIFPIAAASCLQTVYEEPLLDYVPPPAGDISRTFSVDLASDMLIVSIHGGTFQDNVYAGQFELAKGTEIRTLNMPLRDSESRVIFSFASNETLEAGDDYKLTVTRNALKSAASRLTVEAVKGGIWRAAPDAGGIFGTSLIRGIAYGNGKFIAVADEGKMAHSDDGVTWTAIRQGNGDRQSKFENTIRGIAWGDRKFIAVGYEARMASSDDGINWNGWTESLVERNSILCVTYGGGRFVAAGDNGRIIYMRDGGNWTGVLESRSDNKNILALAWGNPYGANMYVAASSDGWLAWSNDAENWRWEDDSFGGATINSLAWGNGYFVAVGDNGKIARSADGKSWEIVSSTFGSSGILSVAFGSGTFIAVGHNGNMAKSSDGQSWTAIGPGNGDNQNKFENNWKICAAGYGGGRFVAAGHPYSGNACRIVYSYQPPEVVAAPSDKLSEPFSVQSGDNRLVITLSGGRFAAESASINHFTVTTGTGLPVGAINGSITERSDTRIVIRLNTPATGGNGLRITAAAAAIAVPPSLITVSTGKTFYWSVVAANQNPFETSNINAFAHNGQSGTDSRFVAVGAGKIAASSDGKSWIEITGTEKEKWAEPDNYVFFTDVAYGNGQFVAVGYWIKGGAWDNEIDNFAGWGVAAVSANGTSWTLKDKIITFSADGNISPHVYAIAHNGKTGTNSRFSAAGQWGRTAYSTDGSSWTAVQIGSFNYFDNQDYFENVLSVAYGDEIFVAAGGNGKTAYSEDNGVTWKWAANILLGDGVPINTVCFGDGKFIAAGNGGNMKIVLSGDIAPTGSENGGDNWQGVNSNFGTTHILAAAYGGSRFIAAGDTGLMSESLDGENWTPIERGSGAEQNKFGAQEHISCLLWGGGRFVAGGNAYEYTGNASKITYSE